MLLTRSLIGGFIVGTALSSVARAEGHPTFSFLDPPGAAVLLNHGRDEAEAATEGTPKDSLETALPEGPARLASLKDPACQGGVARPAETGAWFSNAGGNVMRSAARIAEELDQAKAKGIDVVYPVAWNRGSAFYLKGRSARQVGLADETEDGQRDPLQEFIDASKARGLKVVPWFEYGIKLPCGHRLMKQHPDWMARHRGGGFFNPASENRVCYMNPAKPEVQEFVISMLEDVVRNYPDIKGIQLDDNFPLPVEFAQGASAASLVAVQNQFTKLIAQRLKGLRPDIEIHLSSHPSGWALGKFGQDWPSLVRLGYVDEQNVQNYVGSHFDAELSGGAIRGAARCVPVTIAIYAGETKGKMVSCAQVQSQAARARKAGYGVVYFPFRPDC